MAVTALSGQRWQGQTYNSASFDGTDDKAVVSNAIFNGVTGNFTVAFWFKADTNGDAMMGSYDTGTPNWQIYFSGNEIKISDGSVHVIPEMDFTAGTWYHMAWVRTSGSLQCFINGVVEDIELSTNLGSFASSQTWTQTLDGNNDTFTFGNRGNSGSDTQYFDGQLSEAIFLTEALSQADITTLQTKTAIVVTTMANANLQGYYPFTSNFNDSSDQGRNATANGATITTGSGQPDDKTTVTDVPDGSEFEQTDDYKSYQFGVATGTTNQSAKDSVSGIDANQAEGGWGVKLYGSHTLVGKKITSITTNMRQTASGYTEQTITLKHYGSSSATLRATGSTMSSDDLTGSFLSKTFTFSNPVTVQAGDYILFTIPADLGTSGAWACEIEDGSPESNAYFATWADGGSFYDQTSRALYYSTTYESDPAWVERGTAI